MQISNGGQDYNVTRDGITSAGRALKNSGTAVEQANNWDMADFTCLFVRYSGASRGHPSDGDGRLDRNSWVESRRYQITACASNQD